MTHPTDNIEDLPREPDGRDDVIVPLAVVMDTLEEATAELDPSVRDRIEQDLTLLGAAQLLRDLDVVAERVALAREQVAAHARHADGWARNRAAWPHLGLRMERARSSTRRWDVPRTISMLAGLCAVDRQGEADASRKGAERIISRFVEYASISGFRTTALADAEVDYGDLVISERRPDKIRVFQTSPTVAAGGDAGE